MEFSENSINVILKSQEHDSKYLYSLLYRIANEKDKNKLISLLRTGKDICVNNIDISVNLLKNHEKEMNSEEYDHFVLNRVGFIFHLKELLDKENKILQIN